MKTLSQKIIKYSLKEYKKYIETEHISRLHELKLYLDDIYYNTGDTDFPDDRYDYLKDFLMSKDPSYTPPVGAKVRIHDNNIKLPFYMGSTNKITPDEQRVLDRWYEKNKVCECEITEKLDGISALFHKTENGKKKLYKRGDGVTGTDISYLIQYIKSLPSLDKNNITVRGELIISKIVFETTYKNVYKNARNMVAGITGAKTVRDGLKDIIFVAYEIVGNDSLPKQSKQMKKLEELGFITAMHEKVESKNIKDVRDLVIIHDKFKSSSIYDIDGIIVKANISYDLNRSDNPEYMFAFKVRSDDNIAETTVLDVEWNVSKNGQIIPVYIIEPVLLAGATLSRITGSNAGLMLQNKLGPGSIVNVTRSKDVIPYITEVLLSCDEEDIKMPSIDYEWDDNKVHIIASNLENNPEVIKEIRIKLFSSFFSKLDIKHVSDETIRKLYDNGFDTLFKILGATKKELTSIEGIQDKSATRITENIKNGLNGVKLPKLLGACGVLGYCIGERRIDALLRDIPDLLSCDKKGLKERILLIEGFSDKTADKIIENISSTIEFVDEISKFVTFAEDTRKSSTLVGKVFVMTGFRSPELEQEVSDRGGKCVSSVSKKTSALIVDKKGSGSTKETRAIELGIKIYTRDEFVRIYLS